MKKLLFTILLCFIPGLVHADITTGLVSKYTFNAPDIRLNIKDVIGGNNGQLQGAPTSTYPGVINQALYFDGINDAVKVASVNLSATSKVTVALWMLRYSDVPTGVDQVIVEASDTHLGSNTGFAFMTGNVTGACSDNLVAVYEQGDVGFSGSCYTPPSLKKWHHYVATFDKTAAGAAETNLWIDGVQQVAASRNNNSDNTNAFGNNTFNIGGTAGTSNLNQGVIDDVRVYNRILTQTDINQLLNFGRVTADVSPIDSLKQNLSAWYTLDGKNLVRNAVNSAGTGNTGNLSGYTTTGTTTIPGKVGQGLYMNGSQEVLSANSSFITSTINPHSFFAWIKPTTATANEAIANYGQRSDFNFNSTLGLDSSMNLAWFVNGTAGGANVASTLTVPANVWTFVGMVRLACCVTFYRITPSGLLSYQTFESATSVTIGSNPFQIGASALNAAPVGFYTGGVDDVRFYNAAISTSTLIEIYNIGVKTTAPIDPLKNGLTGWYTFDGKDTIRNITDLSGQGNDGHLVSWTGATSTAARPGIINQAWYYDGSVERVTTGSDFIGTAAVTVAGWANPADALTGSYVVDNGSFTLRTRASNLWRVTCNGGSTAYDSSVTFTPGRWVFVTVTVDASGSARLYFDGVEDLASGSPQSCGARTAGATNVIIGNANNGFGAWNGKLDDIRVYNRVLSANEVKQLYNYGKATTR